MIKQVVLYLPACPSRRLVVASPRKGSGQVVYGALHLLLVHVWQHW